MKGKSFAAVLLAGALTLGSVPGVWAHEKMTAADREKHLDKMAKELSLTQDQKNKIRTIKEDTHTKVMEAKKDCRDKTREVLSPEQQAKFDKMVEDHD